MKLQSTLRRADEIHPTDCGSFEFKKMKDQNPDFTTFEFRVMQYKAFF